MNKKNEERKFQNTRQNSECGSWERDCWDMRGRMNPDANQSASPDSALLKNRKSVHFDEEKNPEKGDSSLNSSENGVAGFTSREKDSSALYASRHTRVDHGKNDSASGYDSIFYDENHEKELPIGSSAIMTDSSRSQDHSAAESFVTSNSFSSPNSVKSPNPLGSPSPIKSPNSSEFSMMNQENDSTATASETFSDTFPIHPNVSNSEARSDSKENPKIRDLEKENFYAFIETSGKVMVDFWAPRCLACRNQMRILDSMIRGTEFGEDIRFARVNVDENPELAEEFGVGSIPSTLLFRNGRPERRFVGLTGARILTDALR